MNIPKHYSLVKEHPKSFELHDARDGNKFHVAKKDLHPAKQMHILRLQKFAEGGDVPDSLDPNGSSVDLSVPTELTPTPPEMQTQYNQAPPGQMAEAFPGENAHRQSLTMPQPAPQAPIEPQGVDPSQLAPAQDAVQQGPNQGALGEFNRAFGLENRAAQENYQAHAGFSQGQEQIFKQQQEDLANIAADHDRKMNDLNQTSDRMFSNLMANKLDPENYWKGHSKIAAGLGILLSGIGSGLSGQRNMAMDVINKNIDADIDAQKTNINQQNNLYKMNLERTHNEQEAYARTKSDMLTMAQAKLNQMAAKMGTPAAAAALHAANANIMMQKAQLHQSIAGMGVARQAYTDGIPPEAVSLLPEKQREQMVRLPNGYMADAGSAANAKEYNEQTSAYVPLMSDLKELKSLNTLGSRMDPAQRARAHELIGHTVVSLNDLAKSHRISESDIGFQSGQLSDPTSLSTLLSGNAATDQLMKSLTRKMDAVGQQYVPAIGNMKAKQSRALSGFKAR